MKSILICCSAFLLLFSVQAQNFDEVVIKTTQMGEGIYMLEGSGGNIGVSVGADGALMVDSQYGPLSDKITAAIAALTTGKIHMLLNTHHHGDHTGGNENFANTGVTIIAHDNVKDRMDNPKAAPVMTFSDKMSIQFNGQYLVMIHVDNAHTDGDAFVYFPESNVIHLGDTYFNGRFPYIDLGSGGSIDGLISAIDQALFIVDDETNIIPGHGAPSNKVELQKYRDVVQGFRDQVKAAMDGGRDLDALKESSIGEEYEGWGNGFISRERFIDIIYNSLKDQ